MGFITASEWFLSTLKGICFHPGTRQRKPWTVVAVPRLRNGLPFRHGTTKAESSALEVSPSEAESSALEISPSEAECPSREVTEGAKNASVRLWERLSRIASPNTVYSREIRPSAIPDLDGLAAFSRLYPGSATSISRVYTVMYAKSLAKKKMCLIFISSAATCISCEKERNVMALGEGIHVRMLNFMTGRYKLQRI